MSWPFSLAASARREVSDRPGERRLAAILAADVVGYARLVGDDEEGTLARLNLLMRELINPKIRERRGRLVKTTGDGMLVEFASPVEAVRCAVEVQRGMIERNADLPQEKHVTLRTGINLADVVAQRRDLFGEGVNIAARLEALCEPGGIAISRAVRDQVRDKLPFSFADAGEHEVKNIARPVRVFVLGRKAVAALPEAPIAAVAQILPRSRPQGPRLRPPLLLLLLLSVLLSLLSAYGLALLSGPRPAPLSSSDLPSIAVLPFVNLGDDPRQDYLSDGVTEDIITELSRFSGLLVIARSSTLRYKGRSLDVVRIGRELGVRYILEGSLRRDGDRLRIIAELIDTATGAQRWAERYDREAKSIFDVEDDVARSIVALVAANVNKAEIDRALSKPRASWDAYDHYMRGAAKLDLYLRTYEVEPIYEARRLFQQALSADPDYARAYAALSYAQMQTYTNALDADFRDPSALERAARLAERAVQLDPNLPQAHTSLAWVLLWAHRHGAAIDEFERALSLNPNFADGRFAVALAWAGQPDRAIEVLRTQLRLDPFHSPSWPGFLGHAYYISKRYDEAVAPLRECTTEAPNFRACHAWLAAALARLGRLEEARSETSEILRIDPRYSIETVRFFANIENARDAERYYDDLRRAGLPER